MKAITTKFLPFTPARGDYAIQASDQDGNRVTVKHSDIPNIEHLDIENRHRYAAEKLMEKMGWKGSLVGGSTKQGFAFCFMPAGYLAVRNALELAEATIQRLAPDGSRATKGTRDVITAALSKGVQS